MSVEPPPQTAEGADQGKQKRKRKAEPPVKLECTICLEDHYTNRCPLLRGPKPTVAYCAAAEDGMGFFMIQQARPNQIVTLEDSDFSALVTVEKGNVSAELLQSELARILPVQWTWSARVNGDKSYIVPFPCKEELERMVAIRNITTKNQEGTLRFEELEADVQPIRVLDQVWVTVTNVPRILKSYLPLWAVGSCIGATQKVDMVHLRKTGEVRILVAAFDVKAIAKQVDICVNRSIYRVYFTADAEVTDDSFNQDEDDLLEDDSNKGLDGNGDHHMDDATDDNNKNQLSSDASNQSSGKQLGGAAPPPQHHAALVEDALTLACNSLLDEIYCKVIMEKDDGAVDARYSPPSAEEVASFEALIHGSGMQENTSHFFQMSQCRIPWWLQLRWAWRVRRR